MAEGGGRIEGVVLRTRRVGLVQFAVVVVEEEGIRRCGRLLLQPVKEDLVALFQILPSLQVVLQT